MGSIDGYVFTTYVCVDEYACFSVGCRTYGQLKAKHSNWISI